MLTDDYQRLDFVLVERYSSEFPRPQETFGLPSTSRQVGVRPRILTVYRRNPDEVALRVLRRFSYTESDTIAQYEKLLSAYDVADWSEPFFNNRALFSDYYLTTRLTDSPERENASEAGAMTAPSENYASCTLTRVRRFLTSPKRWYEPGCSNLY